MALLAAVSNCGYTLADGIGARVNGSGPGYALWMFVLNALTMLSITFALDGWKAWEWDGLWALWPVMAGGGVTFMCAASPPSCRLGDTYTLCGGSLTRFADVSIRLGEMPRRDRSVDAYCLMQRVQQRISEVESLEVRWGQIELARLSSTWRSSQLLA
jgi:hypothetical protein